MMNGSSTIRLYKHDSWEPFSMLVYTKFHINYIAFGYVQVGSEETHHVRVLYKLIYVWC